MKDQLVKKIYGENPVFEYDNALPQDTLERMTRRLTDEVLHESVDEEERRDYRVKVYNEILSGTVYAYDKNSAAQGFLPLTKKALYRLQHYGELIETNLIFTPVTEDV